MSFQKSNGRLSILMIYDPRLVQFFSKAHGDRSGGTFIYTVEISGRGYPLVQNVTKLPGDRMVNAQNTPLTLCLFLECPLSKNGERVLMTGRVSRILCIERETADKRHLRVLKKNDPQISQTIKKSGYPAP